MRLNTNWLKRVWGQCSPKVAAVFPHDSDEVAVPRRSGSHKRTRGSRRCVVHSRVGEKNLRGEEKGWWWGLVAFKWHGGMDGGGGWLCACHAAEEAPGSQRPGRGAHGRYVCGRCVAHGRRGGRRVLAH
jgi:hypothetical protein